MQRLFIRFTVRVYCERLSICVCAPFPFGSEGGICDLIVLVPDHCMSLVCITIIILFCLILFEGVCIFGYMFEIKCTGR